MALPLVVFLSVFLVLALMVIEMRRTDNALRVHRHVGLGNAMVMIGWIIVCSLGVLFYDLLLLVLVSLKPDVFGDWQVLPRVTAYLMSVGAIGVGLFYCVKAVRIRRQLKKTEMVM